MHTDSKAKEGSALERYLARLPDGIASYPECLADAQLLLPFGKACPGVLKNLTKIHQLHETWTSVFSADKPAYIPEAHYMAIMCVIRDFHCADDLDFVRLVGKQSEEIASSALFRVFLNTISPTIMWLSAPSQWAKSHRGTSLTRIKNEPKHLFCRIDFPPDLFPPLCLRGIAASMQTLMRFSRAKDTKVTLVSFTSTTAELDLKW